MSSEPNLESDDVHLSDDDVAFLLSILRDPAQPMPVTTQQLIDALRLRATE
jgi:hypothetical protein